MALIMSIYIYLQCSAQEIKHNKVIKPQILIIYIKGTKLILKDFKISQEFYTNAGKWRCTDVGTRAIVAIALNKIDEKNYNGPPYSVQEIVFNEYDFDGCFEKNNKGKLRK